VAVIDERRGEGTEAEFEIQDSSVDERWHASRVSVHIEPELQMIGVVFHRDALLGPVVRLRSARQADMLLN